MIGSELAAKKAASNRGGGPGYPPKKFELAKLSLLGRLAGIEAVGKDGDIMGDLAYRKRK